MAVEKMKEDSPYWTWGLGFKINFPVSSQDILYSAKTVRHRAAIIDGATTLLCIPAKNKPIRVIQLIVKNGWFQSDVKNDTFCVSGSINQFQAPVAVQTDTTIKITDEEKNESHKQYNLTQIKMYLFSAATLKHLFLFSLLREEKLLIGKQK